MAEDPSDEVLVPCPKCGKLHKISAKEAREKEHVTTPCGAVIGSAGVLRRKQQMDEKIASFRGQLHKLG